MRSESSEITGKPPALKVSMASSSSSGVVCFPPEISTTSPGFTCAVEVITLWASFAYLPSSARAGGAASRAAANSITIFMGPPGVGDRGDLTLARRSWQSWGHESSCAFDRAQRGRGAAPLVHQPLALFAGQGPVLGDAARQVHVAGADGARPADRAVDQHAAALLQEGREAGVLPLGRVPHGSRAGK